MQHDHCPTFQAYKCLATGNTEGCEEYPIDQLEHGVIDPGANPLILHSLLESMLSRLASEPIGKPVGLTTVSPAHFPPIAVNESVVTPLITDLVNRIMAFTNRQEVCVRSQIAQTGSLPFPLQEEDDGPGDGREGPWALLTISDQHASLLSDDERRNISKSTRIRLGEYLGAAAQELSKEGGHLFLESLDPSGTQLWIALPLQSESQDEADVTRVRETIETRLQDSDDSSVKLLVQAESDELRSLLSQNLVEGGYYVIDVRSAAEVLPYARREMPDLIILDLQSRNPSAMDLALMLRGESGFSEIPILFLTEITGPGIGRRMDTVDFLVQPEGASAILQTVDQVLRTGLRVAGRIMVVEPDDDLREKMLSTIQAQGHPVVEARSAEEALALAERVSLGVVLAKANLAEARDYWLVRQLRQLSEDIEIYLMTEGAQSMDAIHPLRKGITGYGDTGRLGELLAKVEDEHGNQGKNS